VTIMLSAYFQGTRQKARHGILGMSEMFVVRSPDSRRLERIRIGSVRQIHEDL